MKTKRRKQSNPELLTLRTGEQFWEDLMKMPHNEDKVGQSFVIVPWKQKQDSGKQQQNQ